MGKIAGQFSAFVLECHLINFILCIIRDIGSGVTDSLYAFNPQKFRLVANSVCTCQCDFTSFFIGSAAAMPV